MSSIVSFQLARGDLKASLPELLRHAEKMFDWEIAHTFTDCLLPQASPEDREALLAYANSRIKSPDFKPGVGGTNNHKTRR